MQITDEMVKAADAAFEASLSRYHGSGFNGYDFFPQIRAALEAALPMIQAGVVEECAQLLALKAEEAADFVKDNAHRMHPMRNPSPKLKLMLEDAVQTDRKFRQAAAAIRALEQKP
jgi:hypothetical protein